MGHRFHIRIIGVVEGVIAVRIQSSMMAIRAAESSTHLYRSRDSVVRTPVRRDRIAGRLREMTDEHRTCSVQPDQPNPRKCCGDQTCLRP